MYTLSDICQELADGLAQVENKCRTIQSNLNRFQTYVSSYPAGKLIRRLVILHLWVKEVSALLNKEHGGKGCIYIILSENEGTGVHWVEREEIVADKLSYLTHGFIVLSLGEISELIKSLVNNVVLGNWERVLDWLATYGKSPGLDFGKFRDLNETRWQIPGELASG